MLSCFTSINVLFDQYNVGKKSKKTLMEVKQDKIWLPLILISTFLCTVKVPKNDLSLHCRRKTKQLSKKELSNVTPASQWSYVNHNFVVLRVVVVDKNWIYNFMINWFSSKNFFGNFGVVKKITGSHWG